MRTAADVMTGNPVTVAPSTTYAACADSMRWLEIRHLVVTNATGKLAGLVADADVLRHGHFDGEVWVPSSPDQAGASIAAAVRPVEAVPPTLPFRDLVQRLHDIEEDVIVIVDEQHVPIGIFTEHDAVRLAAVELPPAPTVAEVMATALVTGTPDMPLQDAWELLEEHGIRHLPIREGSHLVGVASVRDLLVIGASVVAGGTLSQLLRTERALVTTREDVPLRTAADRMALYKIGCLPVVGRTGSLDGLVTATDVIRAYRATLA